MIFTRKFIFFFAFCTACIASPIYAANETFDTSITSAIDQATHNHPEQALIKFQHALEIATQNKNETQARVANFGIAKMKLWLEKYSDAEKIYRKLYQMPLPESDKEIALDGLIRSLNAQNKSKQALSLIPEHPLFTNPHLIVAVAQTYLAEGDTEAAKAILKNHETALKSISENSWLDNQLKQLESKLDENITKKNVLNEKIKAAREQLIKNNGENAYKLIKPYLESEHRVDVYVIAAASMAIMEDPKESLYYYKKALVLSTSTNDKKAILAGITKMQLWLKDNAAKNTAKNNLARINRYIENNDGIRADYLINQIYKQDDNYTRFRLSALSMILMNRPVQALAFYEKAYNLSKTKEERKVAVFGMAKMNFWLAYYVKAGHLYQSLLTDYQLTPKEYQLALAGRVKSLAYYDRPRLAYKTIPPHIIYTEPALVVAAAQASSWSDWSDITKCILKTYRNTLCSLDTKSPIYRDMIDVAWQTDLATAPHNITPSYFYSHDSEEFDKRKTTLDYTHYWNQIYQTSVGLQYIKYTQHKPNQLNAYGTYLSQTVRPTRNLTVNGTIQPYQYKNLTPATDHNWYPVLWDATARYRWNDNIAANLEAKREIIETFPAFSHKITDNLYSAGFNISPAPYVKIDGSIFTLAISDNNRRNGYFVSPNILIIPDLGLSVIGVLRGYTDKFASPYYFSPHRYLEEALLLKLGRRLGATWHYYLDAGAGRQFITPFSEPTGGSPTKQFGLGMNGPISNHFIFNAYYAYKNQASAFLNATDYNYQYGEVSINMIF